MMLTTPPPLISVAPVLPRIPTASSASALHALNPNTPPPRPLRSAVRHQTRLPPPQIGSATQNDRRHQTLLVETFHHTHTLRDLITELSREGSCPSRLLERDGDWTQEQLWPVVRFLMESDRTKEALQVFSIWKNKEISRINERNYCKVIHLLCEDGLLKEATSVLQDMEKHGIFPCLEIYNDIIHGYAGKKELDTAKSILDTMVGKGVSPVPETYNGFIRAYGKYGMYDEMSKCVKWMESQGCYPDDCSYNILIVEFARGKLLERMEGAYRVLRSKQMNLCTSTLVMMLEVYADMGVMDKMEKVYHKILNLKAFIKENIIRKIATVYIENYRFSQLEELGNDMASRTGRTDLFWCLLLVSCTCLMSRKAIESVTREMEASKVQLNVTFINILAIFYMKVRDFRNLDVVFSQAGRENIIPDIVTVGILFDACRIGYNGTRVLDLWKRCGVLQKPAEMKTDQLFVAAFGKGFFIRTCEAMYSTYFESKERRVWAYSDLIRLVFGKWQRQDLSVQVKHD